MLCIPLSQERDLGGVVVVEPLPMRKVVWAKASRLSEQQSDVLTGPQISGIDAMPPDDLSRQKQFTTSNVPH